MLFTAINIDYTNSIINQLNNASCYFSHTRSHLILMQIYNIDFPESQDFY